MSKGWFVGSSYASQSLNADAQKTLNWYLERDESGSGKSEAMLYCAPGKRFFCNLPNETYVPSLFVFNGRLFAAGNHLWEIFAGGTVRDRGILNNPNANPAPIVANQANQLLIACGGNLFVFDLSANVVIPVDMTQLQGKVDQIGFTDAYFAALIRNSNTFQLSNLLDGITWDGTMTAKVEVFPDNIASMVVSFREIWFFGNKKTAVYEDTGDTFPYQTTPSGFLEMGCGAQFASVNLDNSTFWIGSDERGNCMAWRANGYNPQRVSTHAIEYAWSQYPRIDDAIGYPYQDQGHAFWAIYFPSGNCTWVYDAALPPQMAWHERQSWDEPTNQFLADRSRCHAFAFGKHLVGDWKTGNIYEESINFLTDVDETPIRRIRRAPHLSEEDQWIKHPRLQVLLESGLGPQPPLLGPAHVDFPTAIFLADEDGGLWRVGIDDSGILSVTEISSGGGGFGEGGFGEGGFGGGSGAVGQTIIINVGSASWLLGVTSSGNLTTTLITFDPSQPSLVRLASTLNLFALTVTSTGLLVTTLITANFSLVPRGPIVSLRWSNDGGHTWSNYYDRDCGQAGRYKKRVIWNRLGRARDRVYELSTSDPFPARIIDAFLKAGG